MSFAGAVIPLALYRMADRFSMRPQDLTSLGFHPHRVDALVTAWRRAQRDVFVGRRLGFFATNSRQRASGIGSSLAFARNRAAPARVTGGARQSPDVPLEDRAPAHTGPDR